MNKNERIEQIAGRFETEAARLRREADEKERTAAAWRRLLRMKSRSERREESAVAA